MFNKFNLFKSGSVLLAGLALATAARAALFEDDEARKAILDLRQRVENLRNDSDQNQKMASEATVGFGKGLLDLQRQIELLHSEIATLRGANEQLSKELADVQQHQKDTSQTLQGFNTRLVQLEPSKVSVDGVEFMADPAERRDFESALAVFRRGDFLNAKNLFLNLLARYPGSGYVVPSLFWLGNAQYATKDYKEAVINFKTLIASSPDHMRAPESVLSVANCQLELKDNKGARKTLTDLIKAYPQSDAAVAAKERLASLK